MVSLVLVLVAVVTAICIILLWSHRHLQKTASHFIGPSPWPIIGNVLDVGWTTVDVYRTIFELCLTYRPTFRMWLGHLLHVVITDPKDLEIVLSSPKHIDKAHLYKFLFPWLGRGLLTSSGEKWHKHRKLITPTFHFKILEHFLEPINSKGDILIEKLKEHANGPSIDIYPYITLYALDAIAETAMGLDIDAQRDSESSYVNAVKLESTIVMSRMMRPWFYPDVMFNMSADGRKQKEALKVLHGTTRMVIQRKQKELITTIKDTVTDNADEEIGRKKRLAFLDLLLQQNLKNAAFSEKDMQEEVDTFMFEGHDTTASGLSFTLWLLSRHQEIQEKTYAEIERLSSETNDYSKIQTLNEMKYLECVIKESMRLYPPVPIIGRYLTDDLPITGGFVLPAKCSLIIPVTAIHRNPDVYSNPHEFIPERFSLENKEVQNNFAYIPFSAGSRNCIGQKFAMLSMKSTISKFLLHYKLLPDAGSEPVLSTELILKSVNGLKVAITPRR